MAECKHNWHIDYCGENSETIHCVAVCDMCGEINSPRMVDKQLREVQAANFARLRECEVLRAERDALRAELEALRARRCETCRYLRRVKGNVFSCDFYRTGNRVSSLQNYCVNWEMRGEPRTEEG